MRINLYIYIYTNLSISVPISISIPQSQSQSLSRHRLAIWHTPCSAQARDARLRTHKAAPLRSGCELERPWPILCLCGSSCPPLCGRFTFLIQEMLAAMCSSCSCVYNSSLLAGDWLTHAHQQAGARRLPVAAPPGAPAIDAPDVQLRPTRPPGRNARGSAGWA